MSGEERVPGRMNAGLAQNDQDDLPPGWNRAPLGLLASVVGGGTPRRDRREFYDAGTIPWATPTDIDQDRILSVNDTNTRISELGLLKSSAQLLPAGTVLFSSRASIGKIGIAARPMATNQGFANLIPSAAVDALYLAYCLKKFTEEIKVLASGTTYLEVSRSVLGEFPIPLPPLREQRRIVAKIEALFERSRTARRALGRIPPLLKKFRQSVLVAAFRGDLTRDWREQDPNIEPASAFLERIRTERRHKWDEDRRTKGKDPRKAKYKGPDPVDRNDLEDLPEGWEYTTVSEVGCLDGDPVLTGPFGAELPSKEFVPEGVPVVAIGNVLWGKLHLDKVDHVAPEKAHRLRRYTLQPGDVAFTRSGTVGRSAVVPECAKGWLMSYHLLRVRVERSVCDPVYLYLVFRGLLTIRDEITETARGATRPGFNTPLLKRLRFPLPPMDEQRWIICKIDEVFVQADAIEAAVEAARRRAENLEQSILARAFRGGLVPQDPNDEPASTLLDRIRSGRARSETGKGPSGSNTREKKG
ncbi:MAG: restriction endonuclease subunit S [Candidatus Methylomirabilia bacterium]